MYNRYCFWKPFANERVNESQKPLISAEKCFFPTFSSFWAKLSFKKLFLTTSKILGQLVNTLPANYEFSRSNRENLPLEIQINYLKNHKHFWPIFFFFFFQLFESTWNCQCSEKNITVIVQIFLKLFTPKYVLFLMHNRDCFWKPFASELVSKTQKLLKSAKKYFYHNFSSFLTNLSLKKLFLIRSESLGLLVKRLSAN